MTTAFAQEALFVSEAAHVSGTDIGRATRVAASAPLSLPCRPATASATRSLCS